MKRLLVFAAVFALSLVTSGAVLAQSNTSLGTWKLNIAKSTYGTAQPPRSETRTITAQRRWRKDFLRGVGADGGPDLRTATPRTMTARSLSFWRGTSQGGGYDCS